MCTWFNQAQGFLVRGKFQLIIVDPSCIDSVLLAGDSCINYIAYVSMYIFKNFGIYGLSSFDGRGSLGAVLEVCWSSLFQQWKVLVNRVFQKRKKYGQCFSVISWSLWLLRNEQIFNKKQPDYETVFLLYGSRLYFLTSLIVLLTCLCVLMVW
jgi:hypothetical protein